MFTRQELVARALMWHDLGVGCIPLVYRDKNALVKWKGWAHKCPPRPLIEQWIKTRWQCNIGVLLGAKNDGGTLVVLDFDRAAEYVGWRAKHKFESETYTVKTRRGWHVYLWMANAPERTCRMEGGEIKTTGYVVGEGSVHQSGWIYAPVNGSEIIVVDSLNSIGIEILMPEVEEAEREITPVSTDKVGGVVARIKEAISITSYLSRWTDLKPKGDGTYVGKCPFHTDTSPSLMVWPQEKRAYCYSPQCKAHRKCDVITCAQLAMNVSVQEAIKILAQELG